MKTVKSLFLFFALLISFNIEARIIQTAHIADVIPLIDEDSWFLVDLDNTFFEAKQALGHANWFYDQIQERMQNGMTKEEAIKDAYPLWIKTQRFCEVIPLEQDFIMEVQILQSHGVVVMGLTHRQPCVAESTVRQVHSLSVDFLKTAPSQATFVVAASTPTLYTQGILFVGDLNKKIDILLPFLKMINKKPKKIVFIDDKLKNVEELDKILPNEGIEYIGIHYTAIDHPNPIYSPELAAFQYKSLDRILSNEEALILLENNVQK